MSTRAWSLLGVGLGFCTLAAINMAWGKYKDVGPQHLDEMSSIGELLRQAGKRPLHILYVHGIGATGAGDSHVFMSGICRYMKGCKAPKSPDDWKPVKTDYVDQGVFGDANPPQLKYLEKDVWTSPAEWKKSRPFIDHYVIARSDGGPVVVNEINWWPLVFAVKCRYVMPKEAILAGPDSDLQKICAEWLNDPNPPETTPMKAAWINRLAKNELLDWGFSDPMLAVGTMHGLFREAMRQLLVKSAEFNPAGASGKYEWRGRAASGDADREFVVVSHSLGSYLIFSTLDSGQPEGSGQSSTNWAADAAGEQEKDEAAKYILERTSLLYFFANQVPLLELAGIELPGAATSLSKRLKEWSALRNQFRQRGQGAESMREPQIIAWSDPSDLLTWHVPELTGIKVDNLYVRNTWWHWLLASPSGAHHNYAQNKAVLQVVMK
jgi:hypothetical protein